MKRTVCIAAFGTRLGISGGVNVYTRDLIQALAEHGHRHNYVVLVTGNTDAWTFRTWPDHIRFVLLKDIPRWLKHVHHIHWRARRALSQDNSDLVSYLELQALRRVIDDEGIDLIHYPKTVIKPSHMPVRVPLVLTFFDMQQEFFPEFFTARELEYRKKVYRPSVDRADCVVAPSGFTASSLQMKYNTPRDKIVNIAVGVPPSCRRRSPDEVAQVRSRYNLPEHYILYPANSWIHKNHARLMAALRQLRDRRQLKVNLVLTGRLEESIGSASQLALAAGVEDQVYDLGYIPQEEMPSLYTGADMLIFPSLFEGFGIPVLEAMACGTPVAASGTTSIPDVTGDAALLFDPLKTEDIAEAIYRLISDPESARDLARRGLERAKGYAWPLLVDALEEVYAKATRQPGMRAFGT